jgi:hypothetical protein
MTTAVMVAAAILAVMLIARHFSSFSLKDLGAMSPRWLAEHNSPHH